MMVHVWSMLVARHVRAQSAWERVTVCKQRQRGTIGGQAEIHDLDDREGCTPITTEAGKIDHEVVQLDGTQGHASQIQLVQPLQKGGPQQVMRAGQGSAT